MAAASRRFGNDERTKAETVTLIISVLLLAALVGVLVFHELAGGDDQPRIDTELHFDQVYQHGGDWYLPVTVSNVGDRATDVLRVELSRPIPGEEPETSELEYAFVAGGERVHGIAIFDEQPTADTIEVDELAITEP